MFRKRRTGKGKSVRRSVGGPSGRKPPRRARVARARHPSRCDDSGRLWTLTEVETEIVAIVAKLSPGVSRDAVTRGTRFGADLGWDDWSKLRLVKPVRKRLHEMLSDYLVKSLRRVGDLVDYVWSKMEDAP